MNATDLTSTLLAGLLELEQSGDLVLTHPNPMVLADQLCAKVIRKWSLESLDLPIESAIDYEMKSSAKHLAETFHVGDAEATGIVERFVRDLGSSRTPKEVAELLSHQGPQEIALGAYFCAHLQRGKYYGSDYLDWRKNHYIGRGLPFGNAA